MLKVSFRKNHDQVMGQKQTEMRDMCIGIAPYGVKESVLDSSTSLKFHLADLSLWAWHGTKLNGEFWNLRHCRLCNFLSVSPQKTI